MQGICDEPTNGVHGVACFIIASCPPPLPRTHKHTPLPSNLTLKIFSNNHCQWPNTLFSYSKNLQDYTIEVKVMKIYMQWLINSSPPGQFGRKIEDDVFKCIFFNENVRISIKISLKFVPKGPINDKSALVEVMAATNHYLSQCWPSSPTHICGTRGRWVKGATLLHNIFINHSLNQYFSTAGLSLKCGPQV